MNEMEWHLLEDKPPVECVAVEGVELRKGDRVRLRPRQGGDIFDMALAGKLAVIESIEQDYEGGVQLAVVLDDDPGKDLGLLRQPGHRFFFTVAEIEPAPAAAPEGGQHE
jgi:hydrogenase maturation protease